MVRSYDDGPVKAKRACTKRSCTRPHVRFENRGDGEAGAACNDWNTIDSGDYTVPEFISEK